MATTPDEGSRTTPKPKTKRPSFRSSGATSIWIIILTAAVSAAITWSITIATARPHTWGIGIWISDFAKSPGLAGVLAVVAALIAFVGLRTQLAHQRRAETNRAWWERFQWASSRALPADPGHDALPYEAIVNTFTALAESASDQVQEGAVGAVMDVASSRARTAADEESGVVDADAAATTSGAASGASDATHDAGSATPDAGAVEGGALSPDRRSEVDSRPTPQRQLSFSSPEYLRALGRYVTATAGTPADSAPVRARLYEAEVVGALENLPSDFNLIQTRRASGPDLVVERSGVRVGIEVKYAPPHARAMLSEATGRKLRAYRRLTSSRAVLVISNVDMRADTEMLADGIEPFLWQAADRDMNRLVERLYALTS